MSDNEFYEQLDAFIAQAQEAREQVWAEQLLDADQTLNKLILAMSNYKAKKAQEEFDTL